MEGRDTKKNLKKNKSREIAKEVKKEDPWGRAKQELTHELQKQFRLSQNEKKLTPGI